MSSNWLIQDLITLIQQRYPDWNNFTHPPFVKDEIDYKQATATKAQQLLNPDTLQTLLGQADYNTFRDHLIHLGRDNNLLWTNQPSRGDLALLHHPKTDPTTLYPHIFNLLHAPQPSPQRLHTFSQYLHQHDLPNKWTFATYFLFIYHPQTDIFIKPTITRWFLKYMGHATAYHTTPNQDTYHLYQQQIHQLKEDLAAYAPQNMIDLQSFIWVCAREAENRVENLTPEAQIALDIPPTEPLGPIYPLTPAPSPLHLAETNTDNPSPPPNTTPSPPPALTYFTANHPLTPAEQENFPQWQQALQRKGQLIFYGPPGTGKTYTAQRFAQHLTTDTDGFATLIQFHPAYTYEEFIQGLRPFLTETGQLTYRWQNGRFLDICHHARQTTAPCLLIIDEINRANLAHVMGELMYLLEYRHQTINLASGTPFQLPPNLYLIGTMNTADRSLALVDHALRRRFTFIPLTPDYDQLATFHQPQPPFIPHLINLLQEINQTINDPHFHLGTSYFLHPRLPENLPAIWQWEIEPYLEEYFFDRPQLVDQYRWTAIKPRLKL